MQRAYIQSSSEKSKGMKEVDIVELILNDHKPLKKLLKVMKNSDKSFSERRAAFEEFVPILLAHAKPEEQVLYTFMKRDEELREEGFEGQVEHSIADQLVTECKATEDKDLFSARIKVLAELVEHHIKEEEDDLLPDFKKNSEKPDRLELGTQFMKAKREYFAMSSDDAGSDVDSKKEELHH